MHVIALATVSVDGRITPPDRPGTDYASPETGANFMALLRGCDATVTGRATFEHERERMLSMMRAVPDLPTSVVVTSEPDRWRAPDLPAGLEFTDAAPADVLGDLRRRGCGTVLVLGGSHVYATYAPLVDEWQVAVEPVVLGGGTPLFAEVARTRLRLLEHRLLNDDTILLRYAAARAQT